MNIIHTIILGVVEGITEFLPISSTAHLEITQYLLNIGNTDFVKSFEITIQLGAILAVIFLFRNTIFPSFILFCKKVLIAFIPTGIVGFALYKIIKNVLLGNILIVAVMLIFGGIVILLFEKKYKNTTEKLRTFESLSTKELLIIGTAQSLAVIPGVSRSLAVILSGRMLEIDKILITEFSFLLAIPTMLAATAYDLYKSGFVFTGEEWGTLTLGFITAFFTALATVKWIIQYIKTHSFSVFGYYRIVLGLIVLGYFFTMVFLLARGLQNF